MILVTPLMNWGNKFELIGCDEKRELKNIEAKTNSSLKELTGACVLDNRINTLSNSTLSQGRRPLHVDSAHLQRFSSISPALREQDAETGKVSHRSRPADRLCLRIRHHNRHKTPHPTHRSQTRLSSR